MTSIITDILPKNQRFAAVRTTTSVLDFEAICIFVATGFFLDDDTFWNNKKCLRPGHEHFLDKDGFLVKSSPIFKWHYTPRDITFEKVLDEYVGLLTAIIKDQVGNKKIILPLSGGLDSRSQALVIKDFDNPVQAYSYSFEGGYPEHKISRQIANVCGFDFKELEINKGYLWDCINDLAQINQCYSEFTHPRQMAVLNEFKKMEGVFSLGHWGDVLFDRGVPEGTLESEIIPLLFKKMVRPDGFKLAEQLWQHWELDGSFKDYLVSRIEDSLAKIKIDNLSAKVRAFKTSQWAHRWTTTNLSIFEAAHPISMPFYDDRMCHFICTVPETFLADRKIQLAHLNRSMDLSKITWHEQKPFNIRNYRYNKSPFNLPYRILSKLKRTLKALSGRPLIQRNFELQFLGNANDNKLKSYIFDQDFNRFISKDIVDHCYSNFKSKDYVNNAHAISVLLTLSLWNQKFNTK